MIKVVSFKICPFVQRVTAALEANGVPYAVEYISLSDKPQWFLDISPNGQVPVLVTEQGTALFESDAIVEYIEEEFGALNAAQSNEMRALDRAWRYLATKHYLTQCGVMSSKDKATFDQRVEKLLNAFQKMEAQLSGESRFFAGDTLGQVDIAWLPLLHRAAIVKAHSGYDFLCGLPKMQAWQEHVMASGIAEKTVSEDFLSRFSQYYLTNTYLAAEEGQVENTHCCATSSCCD
ncbi:glutathione S-transferase family protein [Thaumasiovibrio subtropicus]|uniref:glutathione S-transferase family protein n=1 Tax=Thaumasiovibrio subtropicus TaxID=1891207 RepID=UPI000B35F7A3|nr:glutathione S-transferase family protein [Thaumasiovibrio subtropicus]